MVHSAKCRAANFPAIHYVRGGDIVFISLHSFYPHVHTEHLMQAELNNVLSTPSQLTHMDTFTLTSSHPHPHTSHHHTPTLTPTTLTPPLSPLHTPSHPPTLPFPSSPLTPHNAHIIIPIVVIIIYLYSYNINYYSVHLTSL